VCLISVIETKDNDNNNSLCL